MAELVFEVFGRFRSIWKDHSPEIVISGPAGTGKTRENLELWHARLQKYPGSRVLMARATRESMTETCISLFNNEVLHEADGVNWRAVDQKYVYPNGSEFIVRGLEEPKRIMSAQYDGAFINEVTDCTLDQWQRVSTRLRNGKMPYQQMMGDCNPGSPTHWVKQRALQGELVLYETTHHDNPRFWDQPRGEFTPEGKAYLEKRLGKLVGAARERLLYGKWVAEEGIVYPEWDPTYHMVKDFDPPASWQHIWIFDFGWKDPFVWQNWVIEPDTHIAYLYQEIYHSLRRVEDHALKIRELVKGQRRPDYIVCDHDAEARATLEKVLDCRTIAAHKPIMAGVNAVKRRLGKTFTRTSKGYSAGLFIMHKALVERDHTLMDLYEPLCTAEEFDRYVWKDNPNKNVDEPVDKRNHGMDCVRYLTAFLDDVAVDPAEDPQTILFNSDPEEKGWWISPY